MKKISSNPDEKIFIAIMIAIENHFRIDRTLIRFSVEFGKKVEYHNKTRICNQSHTIGN
jgi:hypothetical protein